ncbi:hypothetical protein ACHWQZ_G009463 [Mnemiopsis leidyi]
MSLPLRSYHRLSSPSNYCGKRFIRRKLFYNENLELYRPFNNIVDVRINVSSPLATAIDFKRRAEVIDKKLSSCGSINGRYVLSKKRACYFNFSSLQEKEDALKTLSDCCEPLPLSEIKSYNFGQYMYHRYNRPFSHLLTASFRPSIHSTSQITNYLERFGQINGSEVVKCPYDSDRQFLYLSYENEISMKNRSLTHKNPFIKGRKVCPEGTTLDSTDTANDVYIYPFTEHDEDKYNKSVLVRTGPMVFSGLVKNYLNSEYDGLVEKVEKISSDGKESRFMVTFKNRFPVYKMFYPVTKFGQVTIDVPDTPHQLLISNFNMSKSVWKHNYIRFFNAPDSLTSPDQDVIQFFSEFLDTHNINPGIIAASQATVSYQTLDFANRLRENSQLLDSLPSHDTYYDLYFANPWHVVDVCYRLIQLKEAGKHNLHCATESTLFGEVKKFLNVKSYRDQRKVKQ